MLSSAVQELRKATLDPIQVSNYWGVVGNL